jgi:selenocysteine lyase/cysteine desulfurase
VNGVLDYFEEVYRHHAAADVAPHEQARQVNELFRMQEAELLQPLLDFLQEHPQVRLIGRTKTEKRAPTVAFTVKGMTSAGIAQSLADRGFGVGVGDFYARRLVEALGVDPADGVVRLSFVHYTKSEEVQALIAALSELLPKAR